jgi:hypothetical protein
VTALGWLALHNRRLAVRAAGFGIATAAAGLGACYAIFGQAFLDNLMMPRAFALGTALGALGRLQWIAPALVIVVMWAWCQRVGRGVRFTTLFIGTAFAVNFLQKLGAGVDDNAGFELTFAVAIGVALAFDDAITLPWARRLGASGVRLTIVGILIVRLLASLKVSPYLLVASPEFRGELRERTRIAISEVERIAAIPDAVVCTVRVVCRLAGKPLLYDAFFVQQSVATNKLSGDEVERRISAAGLRFVTTDPRTKIDLN